MTRRKPAPTATGGIRCPQCRCRHFSTVEDTRPAIKDRVRRLRKCRNCSTTFVTFESLAFDEKKPTGSDFS